MWVDEVFSMFNDLKHTKLHYTRRKKVLFCYTNRGHGNETRVRSLRVSWVTVVCNCRLLSSSKQLFCKNELGPRHHFYNFG